MKEVRDVPVLVTAFNRPHLLRGLLDSLRAWRPRTVYFAVDGPRVDVPNDRDLVAACRSEIRNVDWGADVHTLFQENNLGCGSAISTAISWFFANVEAGIILEDDVVPQAAFAEYAYFLLHHFRHEPQVLTLSGTTWLPNTNPGLTGTYLYSRFPQVWGWATWRDRWLDYEYDISGWRHYLDLRKRYEIFGADWIANLMWARRFNQVADGRVDTWDYQLVYLALRTSRFTVLPRVSLVHNVGFAKDATHTRTAPSIPLATGKAPKTWTPTDPLFDPRLDRWIQKNAYGSSPAKILMDLSKRMAKTS